MQSNIIALSFSELYARFGGQLPPKECHFSALSTDTRTLQKGEVFIALKGPSFDGHDYIEKAIALGAAGIISEQPQAANHIAHWQVADSYQALAQCAKVKREKFNGKVVAITGSAGKTTVKGMVNAILSLQAPTLSTLGNFNNHVGVPLTVMRLHNGYDYAVVEAGASIKGDISYLVNIIYPHVALVNNVYGAHLDGLGSLAGVAQEKSHIYSHFCAPATAVVNLDTDYVDTFKHVIGPHPMSTYSVINNANADIFASNIQLDPLNFAQFDVHYKQQKQAVTLSVLGRHNVANALAAVSICLALEIPLNNIARGLKAYTGDAGRMQAHTLPNNITLIDDTYNANIGSVKSAIDYLAGLRSKKTLLVLGDIAQLGEDAENMHSQLGTFAKDRGIHTMFAVGELSKNTASAFGQKATWFKHQADLINTLSYDDLSHTVILVKGSRSANMDLIITHMLAHFSKVDTPC